MSAQRPSPDRTTSADPFSVEYARAAPAIYAWAALHLRPGLRRELDPEDLLQEVACRAFARRERYDAELGPLRGWLFGIARKVLYQALQRLASQGRRPDHDWLTTGGLFKVPDEATSVTQRVVRDETIARFLAFVEELPDDERALVLYRGLEGLPHEEVGERLGLEPKAAAKRWERLRERLQVGTPLLA